ncbi:unnamed protein product [Phaedon cochleariae]|uniref:G-protein coupled receptors family 1 profile domain-containing protein n=1 Tax=Phaedon cochleariae TaxID=80249 RepID=A0A9N9X0T9_PHACE|nr:unnamed protein product [Phaedon cochleariae]
MLSSSPTVTVEDSITSCTSNLTSLECSQSSNLTIICGNLYQSSNDDYYCSLNLTDKWYHCTGCSANSSDDFLVNYLGGSVSDFIIRVSNAQCNITNTGHDVLSMCKDEFSDDFGAVSYDWSFLFVVVFIIAGGLGNILVCLAILLDRRLQNVTNYFLLSLAIADLLVSLFVMPLGAIQGFLAEYLHNSFQLVGSTMPWWNSEKWADTPPSVEGEQVLVENHEVMMPYRK